MIYFAQAEIGGPVKIGHTTRLDPRFTELQIGSPLRLHIIGIIEPGGPSEEARLHRRLARDRMHGEWFAGVSTERLLSELLGRPVSTEWRGRIRGTNLIFVGRS